MKLTTKEITVGAILIALAIVLKIFIRYETDFFRLTFMGIPMIIGSIYLGPKVGFLIVFQ